METKQQLIQQNRISLYIDVNYPEWSFINFKRSEVEICDNGDVHYNNTTIIKTGIKLNS